MVIIPLDSSFGQKTDDEKLEVLEEFQMHSQEAGLAGRVVPVWDDGGGRMAFIAPQPWHPFFRSLNLLIVHRNINKEIYW